MLCRSGVRSRGLGDVYKRQINDSPVLKYYLQQGGSADAKVVGAVMNSEDYGIAVKKGNDKLAAEINKALAEMKQNGEYDKLYKTWFGEEKK